MGETQTVFLAEENSKPAILRAMRQGRMYAVHGKFKAVLEAFQIWDERSGNWAEMGSTVTAVNSVRLKIKAYLPEKDTRTAQLRLIREGIVIKEISLDSPVDIEWDDRQYKPGGKTYYRIAIDKRLISNPIFVIMEKNET